MEFDPYRYRQLMDLAALEVAERYRGVPLNAYIDELELIGTKLKLSWGCKSAADAFGWIVEFVWRDELGQTAEIVHVVERDGPREIFGRAPALPIPDSYW
jgi:hypothetical protein